MKNLGKFVLIWLMMFIFNLKSILMQLSICMILERNNSIDTNLCSLCITSPPYLNNLDYGEVSKVHTHFWGITQSWNDITQK